MYKILSLRELNDAAGDVEVVCGMGEGFVLVRERGGMIALWVLAVLVLGGGVLLLGIMAIAEGAR